MTVAVTVEMAELLREMPRHLREMAVELLKFPEVYGLQKAARASGYHPDAFRRMVAWVEEAFGDDSPLAVELGKRRSGRSKPTAPPPADKYDRMLARMERCPRCHLLGEHECLPASASFYAPAPGADGGGRPAVAQGWRVTAPNDGSAEWRACKSKKKFAEEKHARTVAASRGSRERISLDVYKCQYCGCWHLTRQRRP